MSTKRDVLLGVNSHDMEIVDFGVPLTGGDTTEDAIAYYRQKLKIRLWLFFGEWFLDTSRGTPIYEDLLVKNPNVPLIDTLLKARILETDGVTELESYESEYDPARRSFAVNFQAKTDAGLVSLEATIP